MKWLFVFLVLRYLPGDGGTGDLDADVVCNLEGDQALFLLDGGNRADDAGLGEYLVVLFQAVDHGLLLLPFLGLGADQQEIDDGEHDEEHGKHAAEAWSLLCVLLAASGIGGGCVLNQEYGLSHGLLFR